MKIKISDLWLEVEDIDHIAHIYSDNEKLPYQLAIVGLDEVHGECVLNSIVIKGSD